MSSQGRLMMYLLKEKEMLNLHFLPLPLEIIEFKILRYLTIEEIACFASLSLVSYLARKRPPQQIRHPISKRDIFYRGFYLREPWFDCAPVLFEWFCINSRSELLDTLVYRTNNYGCLLNILILRSRIPLLKLLKKYIPEVFPRAFPRLLSLAVENKLDEAFLWLLNEITPFDDRLMLTIIENERIDLLKLVVDKNYKVDSEAFDLAASKGNLEILQYLNSINAPGSTWAVDFASQSGHYEIVSFLLESRDEGFTAVAIKNAKSLEIRRLLEANCSKFRHG